MFAEGMVSARCDPAFIPAHISPNGSKHQHYSTHWATELTKQKIACPQYAEPSVEDTVSGNGSEHLIIQEEGGKCPGKGKGRATWVSSLVLDGGLRTTALGRRTGLLPHLQPRTLRFQETTCQTATQLVLTPHRIPGVAVFYLKSPQG